MTNINIEELANKIKNIVENGDYYYYGLRKDDYEYNIGDICHKSHQLWQDPEYDEDGELIYPHIWEGPYKGFYDGGELDGTCSIGINEYDDDEDIITKINLVSEYIADHLYLIAGKRAQVGNDREELIIENAVVLAKFY